MKRYDLSTEDNKRGHRAALGAAILAALLSLLILSFLFQNITDHLIEPIVLIYSPAALLGTWLSVRLLWKRLIYGGETRKRGARYGACSALLALFLMSFFAIIFMGFESVLIDGNTAKTNIVESLILLPLLTPLLFFYAFILGGFLTIPLGAFAGYMLTKDPE